MKLDAHAIVGANNETLLVRGAQYPLSRLVKDYEALLRGFESVAPLFVGRSFVDTHGNEVLFEQLTPRALQVLAGAESAATLMTCEVWHKVHPDFRAILDGDALTVTDFKQVSRFLMAPEADDEALLDEAYARSQNVTTYWVPVKNGKGCRSTSVGDVLVLYRNHDDTVVRQAYLVDSVGFQAVQFQ